MTREELRYILAHRGKGRDGKPAEAVPAGRKRRFPASEGVGASMPPLRLPQALGATVCVLVPVKTVSEANRHAHWRDRQQRAKLQRQRVTWCMVGQVLPPLPAVVTMTRVGQRTLDDDNLAGALKATRDSIADLYGVDDGDGRYEWVVKQEKSKTAWGVRIEMRGKKGGA